MNEKRCLNLILTFLELVLIATLFLLNHYLRYNIETRNNLDLFTPSNIYLPCDEQIFKYKWSYPYYELNSRDREIFTPEVAYYLYEDAFYLYIILVPICMFVFTETLKFCLRDNAAGVTGIHCNGWFHTLYCVFQLTKSFLAGLGLTGLIVSFLKLVIVAPRPHFATVCLSSDGNPASFPVSCANDSFWNITKECHLMDDNTSLILEALKSFPSYHAALAAFSGFFVAAYMTKSSIFIKSFLLQVVFMTIITLLTIMCATYRMAIFYAFPQDIYAGVVIGGLLAWFTISGTINCFKSKKENFSELKKESNPQEGTTVVASRPIVAEGTDANDEFSSDYKKIADRIDSISFLPRIKEEFDRSKGQKSGIIAREYMQSFGTETSPYGSPYGMPPPPRSKTPPPRFAAGPSTTWYDGANKRPYDSLHKRAFVNYGYEDEGV